MKLEDRGSIPRTSTRLRLRLRKTFFKKTYLKAPYMAEKILDTIYNHYRKIRRKIPVRKILGLKSKDDYWNNRSDLHYYQVVKSLVEEHSPGNLIMDVGAWNTPAITWGDFKRRIAIDRYKIPSQPKNVEAVCADWLNYQCDEISDVILCLQVLEHLSDAVVESFAKKIVRSGRIAIISVPFMWKEGQCEHHLQDPVDLKKLEKWVGYSAIKHIIEDRDTDKRLIALFKGSID